ncbi:hypothetical protein Tco_1149561 [Tanacetum coccineum]
MAKPILDNTRAEQSIAEPKTNCDEKFELCKELLSELRNNAYNGRVEEDVIDHITKILEILDLVKIANVDPFQLRVKAFPLSLAGEARKWWMNEGYGKINTWEELVKKFFGKFYPVSCANNYDKMCDDEEGRDSLEFIILMNSKFNDHKKVDETIKRALLHSWIEVGKNEGIMNDIVSSNEEWEEHEYGNPPNTNDDSFLEPYLDAHNKNAKRNECNPMKHNGKTSELGIAPHLNNVNDAHPKGRMCKTEKFKELAVKKSTIWYTLKKTCAELVRAILMPRQHTFAQELKLENHLEQHIRGVPRSNSISHFL